MKKVLIIISAVSSLFFISCEDSFQPKADFVEQYVLNSIIKADSSVQVATLSRSYDVDGFDPYTNIFNTAVRNAEVILLHKNKEYILTDSVITDLDTLRYKDGLPVYIIKGLKPGAFDSISIKARTPDGKLLSARTRIAPPVSFRTNTSFFAGDEDISVRWEPYTNGLFYLPRLTLVYTKLNENPGRLYSIEVPLSYTVLPNTSTANFPGLTRSGEINFSTTAVDSAMKNLSKGDPDKQNYKIYYLTFELLSFDQPLSSYISVSNGFLDPLTIRTDKADYSNISGGLGIFGSTSRRSTNFTIDREYVVSFGYKP